MSLTLVGILGIAGLMLLLFVFGMPVSFAMALVGFGGFSYILNVNAGVNMVSQEFWAVFSNYGLTVIPLFVFMGQIAFYSGVNERLYKAAYKWVGHIRGGPCHGHHHGLRSLCLHLRVEHGHGGDHDHGGISPDVQFQV